ncbi:MAG: YgiQ family radical SAM protein [Bacteroidales bacterium]|nr:YgiQ family radical SAM protein [Candidatus Equimonas faecalis]
MQWLPTTKKECERRGWDVLDVVLFSGDAYVDHPSFGAAVIGRTLEAIGLRVAIVPQPDWHGDHRDFLKLGRPRYCFMVSPGAMDSMVNRYTAARRLRSEDAYTPDGRHDGRPEMPSIVYAQILRQHFPDVPIVLGGIEASMRRLTHYDYWQDRVRPCLLADSPADMIIYGMGELPVQELCRRLDEGVLHGREEALCSVEDFRRTFRRQPLRQSVMLWPADEVPGGIGHADIVLHSHAECLRDKRCEAANFRHIEEQSNVLHPQRLLQLTPADASGREVMAVVEPPFPPMTEAQIDASFDLPYTRLPHPKYNGKRIPAYEMIKFSVCLHRGCFGGCAFCTISAHQGKFIASRSKASILREVEQIVRMPDFRGYLSDLGGPSANMYRMEGKDKSLCAQCRRPSCIHPAVCPNLNADHRPLLDIYRAVDALPGIKKSFVGSGVRYDLLLHDYKDPALRRAAEAYTRELITRHVSGRLKVAPEHTSDRVLRFMRKPSFRLFERFKEVFDRINRQAGLRQQIVPYFISSHPGCREEDMRDLADRTRRMDFRLEQVQDFTPTPMTVSTETWYCGVHPYTLEPVFSATTPEQKRRQNQYFFWWKKEPQGGKGKRRGSTP